MKKPTTPITFPTSLETPANKPAPPPAGAYAEEIASNAMVVGNLNSQHKYNQTDNGPYDEMSKGASVKNKYLEKIANAGVAKLVLSPVDKLKLGLSSTGLAMSATGLGMSIYDKQGEAGRNATAKKSLTALNNINKALSVHSMAPSSMAVQRPKFNNPTNKL